jgi:hypothetical protein
MYNYEDKNIKKLKQFPQAAVYDASYKRFM